MALPYKSISRNFDIVLNDLQFYAVPNGCKFVTKTAFNSQETPDILVKVGDGLDNNSVNLDKNMLGYVPSNETVYMVCNVVD